MVLSSQNISMPFLSAYITASASLSKNDANRPTSGLTREYPRRPSFITQALIRHTSFPFEKSMSAPHLEFDDGTPRRVVWSLTVPFDCIPSLEKGFNRRKVVVVVVEQTL